MDYHNAVFWCGREQDMVTDFDIVNSSRCSWDNDVRLKGHGEKTIGGGENYDAAWGWDYFKLVPRLPAESTDDISVRDPPGCVHAPDAVEDCGVA
jgi:hypothetical protein